MTAGDREQAGQQELEAGTHISAMSRKRESKLAVVWGSKLSKSAPTGTLPPRPHLLSLLEQHHQLGSSIQIPEIRGTFLNQATTYPIIISHNHTNHTKVISHNHIKVKERIQGEIMTSTSHLGGLIET